MTIKKSLIVTIIKTEICFKEKEASRECFSTYPQTLVAVVKINGYSGGRNSSNKRTVETIAMVSNKREAFIMGVLRNKDFRVK